MPAIAVTLSCLRFLKYPVLLRMTISNIITPSMIKKDFHFLLVSVLLVGDDLNDFTAAQDISMEKRTEIVEENKSRWGRQWYLLPNPIYGSWQEALYKFNDTLSENEKRELIEDQFFTRGKSE